MKNLDTMEKAVWVLLSLYILLAVVFFVSLSFSNPCDRPIKYLTANQLKECFQEEIP